MITYKQGAIQAPEDAVLDSLYIEFESLSSLSAYKG